jgi:hypothetical protein
MADHRDMGEDGGRAAQAGSCTGHLGDIRVYDARLLGIYRYQVCPSSLPVVSLRLRNSASVGGLAFGFLAGSSVSASEAANDRLRKYQAFYSPVNSC